MDCVMVAAAPPPNAFRRILSQCEPDCLPKDDCGGIPVSRSADGPLNKHPMRRAYSAGLLVITKNTSPLPDLIKPEKKQQKQGK
jgi:hypothetical protein